MKRVETSSGAIYQCRAMNEIPWLVHGFGTRGVELKNYLDHLGAGDRVLVKTNQVHGNRVHLLDGKPLSTVYEGDAFVTASRGIVCFVRTADCVPILLCDPTKNVVAAVHAGWRGTACDVAGSAVCFMAKRFGCQQSDLVAAIGPSICSKCYSVGKEVIDAFAKNGFADSLWRKKGDGLFSLDLEKANRYLLLSHGLTKTNISSVSLCTHCRQDDFASYRRDRWEKRRQVSFIFIK